MTGLTPAQRAALAHARSYARDCEGRARALAAATVDRAGLNPGSYDQAVSAIRECARVIVHFHPDHCRQDGFLVAKALLNEGIYRNQFETGISNGSLTAFPGGPRDTWEKALFGDAYQIGSLAERPKYGALELVRFPDGPIPRFGSCYLVLNQGVKARTSFTFMGSEHPKSKGSLGDVHHLHGVMANLLAEVEAGGVATPDWPPWSAPTLGVRDLTVKSLLECLAALPNTTPQREPGRVLDSVIEAQIHGLISLRDDVDEVVCDPSFLGTEVGAILESVAGRFEFALSWHGGFSLPVGEVPSNFRGERMPRLAERVAGCGGKLDAAAIGDAWRSLKLHPERWADWAPSPEAARHLQQLWHTVVHYGAWPGTSE